MAYVYEHWRPDLGQPFWVGKGTGKRRHVLSRRNRHHSNIVGKLNSLGLEVEIRIVADGLSDESAFELEKKRIEFWRDQNIRLANVSVGGKGGMAGMRRSEESRAKQSSTMTGRKLSTPHIEKIKARNRCPEARELVRSFHTGRKRPEATGKKISLEVKRSWTDPKIRSRRLAGMTARKPVSNEGRARMRAAKTPEARAKISAAAKRQWQNPKFRKLVSDTMKRTNAARREASCAG
jgi:hypothetical protein